MRLAAGIAAIVLGLITPVVVLAQDRAQCEANFEEEGNFFTGTRFSTFQDFPQSPDDLFRSTLFAIVSDGFQVVDQDREMRIISAAQTVTGGQGSTAPLNVIIEDSALGSRARLSFTIAGGQLAHDPMRNICDLMQRFGG